MPRKRRNEGIEPGNVFPDIVNELDGLHGVLAIRETVTLSPHGRGCRGKVHDQMTEKGVSYQRASVRTLGGLADVWHSA